MDHVITVGMVLEASAAVIGAIVIIGGLLWMLSIFASGFDH